MGREDDVPLAIKNHVELHVPSVAVVSVFDFVLENHVTFHQGRQLGDVNSLLLHRQVFRLRVVPDTQVSLTLLQRLSHRLYRQILFAHVRDTSLWVSFIIFCIVFIFETVLPLSIGNDVDAVLDILSVLILLRFYESEFDIVIIELLVRNAVAGCSKQYLHEFRSLMARKLAKIITYEQFC